MLEVLMAAFVIGLAFNAAPGVITAQTLSIAMRSGFWASMKIQLGSLVGDAVWAILGLIGISWIMTFDILVVPMLLSGGMLMMWLSYQTLIDVFDEGSLRSDVSGRDRHAFYSGAFLSLSNPMNLSYWLGIGTIVHAITLEANHQTYMIFFAGFMIASVVWCFIMSGIAILIAAHASKFVLKSLFLICAIVVALFGGHSILNALSLIAERI